MLPLLALAACDRDQTVVRPESAQALSGPRPLLRSAPPPVFVDPRRRERLASALPAIDAYLRETIERDNLVGLAAGVIIDDELVWAQGYGLADPANNLPVRTDTSFGIGSITKTVTTLAVLKLREQGRLDLSQAAATVVPELGAIAYPSQDSPPISIHHLLTHTSGLPRMGNFPEYPATPPSRAAFLDTLTGMGLDRAPGIRRTYSNLGFQLLGPVIDAAAGQDHRTYIREEILRPIGMVGAQWTPEAIARQRLAIGHELDELRKPRPRPHWRPGAADAAGGLYASVEDLAAYAIYNLQAWPPRDAPESGPLRRATLREAHQMTTLIGGHTRASHQASSTPQVQVAGTGLGFAVYTNCDFGHVVAHAGKTLGYRASLHMLPKHGVAVVLLSNLSSIPSGVLPNDGEHVLRMLAETGALKPRQHVADPALAETARRLAVAMGRWDLDAYTRTFSPDYRDSHPAHRVASEIGEWQALVGACEGAAVVEASDSRAGVVKLACAQGELHLQLRVAPWLGAPITSLKFLGVKGRVPSPAVQQAAMGAEKLIDTWDEVGFSQVFAPTWKLARIQGFLAAVRRELQACKLGAAEYTSPNGATFELECEAQDAIMHLELDPKNSLITRFEIRPPANVCG